MTRVGIKHKKIATLAITAIIIGIIFSPFPGIEAITIQLGGLSDNTVLLDIIVRDQAAIVFPNGDTADRHSIWFACSR